MGRNWKQNHHIRRIHTKRGIEKKLINPSVVKTKVKKIRKIVVGQQKDLSNIKDKERMKIKLGEEIKVPKLRQKICEELDENKSPLKKLTEELQEDKEVLPKKK